jgi:hypothetical protein
MKRTGAIVILLVFVEISLQGMHEQKGKNSNSKKEIQNFAQLKEEIHNMRRELPKNKDHTITKTTGRVSFVARDKEEYSINRK